MLSPSRHSLIAREGLPIVLVLLLGAFMVNYIFNVFVAIPLWFLVILSIYMFRDPHRIVPSEPLAIICPVDGVIKEIETVDDVFIQRKAIRIVIRMSMLGTYIIRSPTEGKVMERWFPNSTAEDSRLGNRVGHGARFAQWIRTDENDDVIVCMSGGILPLRPTCNVQSGERVGQGIQCGYIILGAIIEVILPANSSMQTRVGDRVRSGTDILAYLVHK